MDVLCYSNRPYVVNIVNGITREKMPQVVLHGCETLRDPVACRI